MPIYNPSEFDYQDSRWEDIFVMLKDNGINVKSPTRNVGIIREPTVIVRYDGTVQHGTFSTDDYRYELIICVPSDQYSKLEPYVVQVRELMKNLYPMLVDERNVSTSMYDDEIRAHYVSCTYQNHRKFSNY